MPVLEVAADVGEMGSSAVPPVAWVVISVPLIVGTRSLERHRHGLQQCLLLHSCPQLRRAGKGLRGSCGVAAGGEWAHGSGTAMQ